MGTKADPGDFDCYEAAEEDEPLFVLLARDASAPELVRAWARGREARVRAAAANGNASASEVLHDMDQVYEALSCAMEMDRWYAKNRGGDHAQD